MSNGISNAIGAVSSLASSMKQVYSSGFDRAKDVVTSFISKVAEMTGLNRAIEGVGSAFGSMTQAISSAIDNALSLFRNLIDGARSAGSNVIDAFVSGVKSVIANVKEAFEQLGEAISSVWDAIKGNAKQAGTQTATAYAQGVQQGPRARMQAPVYSNGNSGSGGGNLSSLSSFGDGQLLSAVNTLNNNIMAMGSSPTNVNVTLSGSAKNIFDTVRVQNTKLQTATGYHALA